jgi:hypothetical protein
METRESSDAGLGENTGGQVGEIALNASVVDRERNSLNTGGREHDGNEPKWGRRRLAADGQWLAAAQPGK